MKPKTLVIYTDGCCLGNPGPGGCAAVLHWGSLKKVVKGKSEDTTNNRMELKAVILGLSAIKRKVPTEVYTDSQYIRNGVEKWMKNWKASGWKKSNGRAIKNKDLWIELDVLLQRHQVNFNWVKGHSDIPGNIEADALAKSAAQEVI